MSVYSWTTCPEDVRSQVDGFSHRVVRLLGDKVVGIYLHGSLAMGCFNPQQSDLDLLVVTTERMEISTRRQMMELLLESSQAPCPLEISFIVQQELVPWQFPTPYDLHYGESWRQRYVQVLASGDYQQWHREARTDPDLAAHITITRERGHCLYGAPIERVFPKVPAEDYLASILADVKDGLDHIWQNPVYAILNACRVYAYLRDGFICSKQEGGTWALTVVPEDIRPLVALALEAYTTGQRPDISDSVLVKRFVDFMHVILPL